MIKGNLIYHFKGKVVYNLSFSQNHNRTKICMRVWLKIGLNMARKWLIWGILLFFFTRFTMSNNLANQKKMDLVGETDKVHLII